MKICAYVQATYGKAAYKREHFDRRQWAGLCVVLDAVRRAGYDVDFAGVANVHLYDVVLVSITSDCDWWSYLAERRQWQPGSYKVIVGGAGVLNVRPFLPWADWFCLGRGEETVPAILRDGGAPAGVIESADFSPERRYEIAQGPCYPHEIRLAGGDPFLEVSQGCPHKCLFCGYTWQRRHTGPGDYIAGTGIWDRKERSMLDLVQSGDYDFRHLRTTSIDGFSERVRRSVNKPITRDILRTFLSDLGQSDPPHQLKLYNVIGLPGETEADWQEFTDTLAEADWDHPAQKQWSIVLHSTPFRPMPATPLACAPASYRDYRGRIAAVLGQGRYRGNIFYRGQRFWAVEGMGTDSLSTHALSMVCHRGTEVDADAVAKLAATRKFWSAPSAVRLATLERYFDVGALFGAYTADTLPTRYLRTYAKVENMWPRGVDDHVGTETAATRVGGQGRGAHDSGRACRAGEV